MDGSFYHGGARSLQDRFDSRRIADRLEQVTLTDALSDRDAEFVRQSSMFFLATCEPDGQPDVSYKGGAPGFVRVLDEQTLAFPHYDGNGQFRSLGNVLVHPSVALLFIDFERPARLRVQGDASVAEDDPLLSTWPRAQLVVRVRVRRVFPNCPRYVHRMTLDEYSIYLPSADAEPPVPDWKRDPLFADALPDES